MTTWPESVDPPRGAVRRFHDPAGTSDARPLPHWWPDGDRPLVYITFGSVAAQVPPAAVVYPKALEAAAGLDARVLLTLGVGAEVELGEVPPNVHIEKWVPQQDVLPHAAAVVGHGGAGTTLGALGAGVPQVVVPLFADQPANAARIAIAGAGVAASIDGIGAAIEHVLADDSYRSAARRVADEMRRLASVDEFVRDCATS